MGGKASVRVTQGNPAIPWWLFFPVSLVESLAALFLGPPQVVDIMRVNVDKVLKRDEILSELDDRADALQMGASQFESSAAKLKRKYWWKNCKVNFLVLFPLLFPGPQLTEGQKTLRFYIPSL